MFGERKELPPGWVRDPNNPGLIKLSGPSAGSENALMITIRKMEKRIVDLEKKVEELHSKLNKVGV
jgi:hypothetical protein